MNGYEIGGRVIIIKCEACPGIIGKAAKIKGFTNDPGHAAVELNFGRGRPLPNRPKVVSLEDIRLAKE